MPLGDSYATTAALKARVGISDSVDDAPITEALASASRHVEKICRRQFNDAGTPSPRTYDPDTWTLTVVDDFSTDSGLIVKTDDDDDGTFETTWTLGTDFELRPLGNIRDGVAGWPYFQIYAVGTKEFPNIRRAGVQVTAKWGWTAVPAPIKEATLILGEEIWKMKDAPFGVAGFGEFGSIRIRENPKVQALLGNYRRKAVRVR